jgi:hypothetical protein
MGIESPFFSCEVHLFFSEVNSASARDNSSLNSSTRLSWAAMAMMKPFASAGEATVESIGVGGTDDMAEVGVGREGSLVGGAIGSVRESRLTWRFMLDTLDFARV